MAALRKSLLENLGQPAAPDAPSGAARAHLSMSASMSTEQQKRTKSYWGVARAVVKVSRWCTNRKWSIPPALSKDDGSFELWRQSGDGSLPDTRLKIFEKSVQPSSRDLLSAYGIEIRADPVTVSSFSKQCAAAAHARKVAQMVGGRWNHWLKRKAWDSLFNADIMRQGASESALTFYAGHPSETQDVHVSYVERLQRENEQLKLELRQTRLHQTVQESEIRQLQQEVVDARMREAETTKGEAAYAARFKMLLGALQDVEETLARATTSAHRQSAVFCILRSIHCETI